MASGIRRLAGTGKRTASKLAKRRRGVKGHAVADSGGQEHAVLDALRGTDHSPAVAAHGDETGREFK